MKRLLSQIMSAILGLLIASQFLPGIVIKTYPESNFFGFSLTSQWHIFLFLGIILGLLNFFAKPLLKTFNLPLKIITLELFGLIISAGLIWILDMIFDELYIPLFSQIIYSAVIIWGINIIIENFLIKYNQE